jgi:uncharacterized protein
MITRAIVDTVTRQLDRSPAVALLGPRQVGKTTLARALAQSRPSIMLDLERPRDLAKLADIETFCEANRDLLIILDEFQRSPELFAPLRAIIDEARQAGRESGQFLLLGSASIDLLHQASESLAGRIAYTEMGPLTLAEVTAAGHDPNVAQQLYLRGGYPTSLLAGSDQDSLEWREDFIRTYLERDIPALGPRIPAETLGRFWTMLAHQQGAVLNAANMARSLSISGATVARYLDLMCDLMLVRRLQPWTSNMGKRLVRSPKIYVRDAGIVHALLGIETFNDLLGHPVIGGSYEGFVLDNITAVAPPRTRWSYYRSAAGSEIDIIAEPKPGVVWAIEVKRSSAPTLSRGFHTAAADVGADEKFVVYPGEEAFSLGNGVQALPLLGLMARFAAG